MDRNSENDLSDTIRRLVSRKLGTILIRWGAICSSLGIAGIVIGEHLEKNADPHIATLGHVVAAVGAGASVGGGASALTGITALLDS